MRVVLVVAPHPDDETLGVGGTLLRHVAEGDAVHWLIATASRRLPGISECAAQERERQIDAVATVYGMRGVHRLDAPPAGLDALPLHDLVRSTSAVFEKVAPEVVYLPHRADAHSDHRRCYEMCVSAIKWFRGASIREVYAYETLSETGFDPAGEPFRPTAYVDIGERLEEKLAILGRYVGEVGEFPFPRSPEAVRALAALRGTECGFHAAEAFAVLRLRR